MAKAAGAGAAPDKKNKNKKFKKKERKHVPHGLAMITASFNNTIVTISDPARRGRCRDQRASSSWAAVVVSMGIFPRIVICRGI